MKSDITPRQFMSARHPEAFSDSVDKQQPVLDRSLLEYHLATLTSRNQETEFASFAQKLAERTICPNLRPQTGPTGGGDSKVDSETYPVSDLLALTWYEGIGREASRERWAFAFSAKKDWRPKARSDIAKIASTDRGYSKAFFVTNQYIPDRARGEIEDNLSKEHAPLDVRILDLTWILDRIFTENLQTLVISELGLEISTRTEVQKGHVDIQKERDLEEIEARIKTATDQNRLGLEFANDCIESAVLSRGLGYPRTAVEGRFQRAQQVSESHGTPHQQLVSAYQWAWTVFWWYEDYPSFIKHYSTVEGYAKGTDNVYDLELLSNLWHLHAVLVEQNTIELKEFNERTSVLASELERLSQERSRPSTALQAKSPRLLMKILTLMPDVDDVLRDLRQVVLDSEGLIGYPLEPLVEILMELGTFLTDRQSYEDLFETVLEIAARRKGEVESARIRLRRGAQQLDADRPYDAIVTLGLALGYLFKHETERDLVRALYLCSNAYERIGLLWAARGTLLNGAAVAMSDFWTHSKVTPSLVICSTQMKWLELKLGRLPHVLAWHEIDSFARMAFVGTGSNLAPDHSEEANFDAVLGILILKSDIWSLGRLSFLPDVLEKLGLFSSQIALRFALGDEDQLWRELTESAELEDKDIGSFFRRWRQQPAASDLPDRPVICDEARVSFESNLLGCRIHLESENKSPCVELAESVLAALESLMATGFRDHIFPRESILTGGVRTSHFPDELISFDLRDRQGRPHLEIRCSDFSPHDMSGEAQQEARNKLRDLVIAVMARVYILKNPEDTLTKLLHDEGALERAVNYTSSLVVQGNVLGSSPKTKISKWKEGGERHYPLNRFQPWNASEGRTTLEDTNDTSPPEFKAGQGELPADLLDIHTIKHTEIESISLIREALWEPAGWSGTEYITAFDDSMPPILALIFKDRQAARQIFTEWRQELGAEDEKDRLRLSIIRGIEQNSPSKYRVIIGANMATAFTRPDMRFATMNFRLNTMAPSSDENLVRFLEEFRNVGRYVLAYAQEGDGRSPMLMLDDPILKHDLHVREAWEIGRHDADSIGVMIDDDPIIPATQQDPPVRELIEWKRSLG